LKFGRFWSENLKFWSILERKITKYLNFLTNCPVIHSKFSVGTGHLVPGYRDCPVNQCPVNRVLPNVFIKKLSRDQGCRRFFSKKISNQQTANSKIGKTDLLINQQISKFSKKSISNQQSANSKISKNTNIIY
jgi:hypothetical protein